jgi:hypothetical protein
MNLTQLVAVSGMPGIYRVISNKPNGLIVEDLKEGKRQFISARNTIFTPLESIFIYINDSEVESIALKDVFVKMVEKLSTIPTPTTKANDKEFKAYLAEVLPNYDKDRVYVSDMKKLIKWFTFLNDLGILTQEDAPAAIEEAVVETPIVEEEKPKKKTTKKKEA